MGVSNLRRALWSVVAAAVLMVTWSLLTAPPARSEPDSAYSWFNGRYWQSGKLDPSKTRGSSRQLKVGRTWLGLTSQVVVKFRAPLDAADAATWGGRYQLTSRGFLPGTRDTWLFEAGSDTRALQLCQQLMDDSQVASATPNFVLNQKPRALPDDTLFPQQWHLRNTGQTGYVAGNDIDVVTAWDSFTGTGAVVQIVDTGIQVAHPDLNANILLARCFNYQTGTTDPTPSDNSFDHGTECAGVAAGIGDNNLGITGVAFDAQLIGLNLIGGPIDTVANTADAMVRNSDIVFASNNSFGPDDSDGPDLVPNPEAVTAAQLAAVTSGRGGKGVVFCWAGGNGNVSAQGQQNSNQDGSANSRFVLAIGASDGNGKQCFYSESGANLMVNAPSWNFAAGTLGLVTTDMLGAGNLADPPGQLDYDNRFNGTSGSAPVASGAVALILQSKPSLTWRDVIGVLATSSAKNDPGDSGWFDNAAGLHFNHKYGFGRVDVTRAILVASTWPLLGPETTAEQQTEPNVSIPDNDAAGVSSTLSIIGGGTVETVQVTLTAPHQNWCDLDVKLTSPSGTTSVLNPAVTSANVTAASPGFDNWTFTSRVHYGETAAGSWTLNIADRKTEFTGTFVSWKLSLYGTSLSAQPAVTPTPTPPPTPTPAPTATPATSANAGLGPETTIQRGGPDMGEGGCFIATAAYGTATEEHVVTLRGFRDHVLMPTPPGRWFVATYYRLSPPVADFIRDRAWARFLVRVGLAPIIFSVENPALACWIAVVAAALLWRRRQRRRAAAAA